MVCRKNSFVFYAMLLFVFSSFAFGLASPCGSYGDVNNDSFVTQEDSLLVSNYIVGNATFTDAQKIRADVTGDSAIDIADAAAIANYAASNLVTFSVCSGTPSPPPNATASAAADLVVSDIVPFSNAVPTVGIPFHMKFYVKNIGNLSARGTSDIRVQVLVTKADGSNVDDGDTSGDLFYISELGAGQSWNGGIIFVFNHSGEKKITATVDSTNVVVESNEGNNALSKTISVLAVTPGPPPNATSSAAADLIVSSITLNPSTTPHPGEGLLVTVYSKNIGNLSAKGDIRVQINAENADGSAGDSSNNVYFLSEVLAGSGNGASGINFFFKTPGAKRISAFVDSLNIVPESNENNNKLSIDVTVANSTSSAKPDLVVSAISFSPSNPKVGEDVKATITFKNAGSAAIMSDFGIGSTHPNGEVVKGIVVSKYLLQAGEEGTATMVLRYSVAGTFPVKVILDNLFNPYVVESDETNNERSVDLVVGGASLDFGLASDKVSYSLVDTVRLNAKTYYNGAPVTAYITGSVTLPDGRVESLGFSNEACPVCEPGHACAAVVCPTVGLQSASFKPSQAGTYLVKATASYGGAVAESTIKFEVGVLQTGVKLLIGEETSFGGYNIKFTTVVFGTPNLTYFDITSPDGSTTNTAIQVGSAETIDSLNVRVVEIGSAFQPNGFQTAFAVISLSTTYSTPLELSLAADRSSYSLGDEVRLSATSYSNGVPVAADVTGSVTLPDGRVDYLVFSKEANSCPVCKPGQNCVALACQRSDGLSSTSFKPSQAGTYYVKATASYGGAIAVSEVKFEVGVKNKADLSVGLGSYNYKPGSRVKIVAKLLYLNGEPVSDADVYANVYFSGGMPKAEPLMAVSTPEKVAPLNQVANSEQAVAVAPSAQATGYAVQSIASSVERRVSTTTEYSESFTSTSSSAVSTVGGGMSEPIASGASSNSGSYGKPSAPPAGGSGFAVSPPSGGSGGVPSSPPTGGSSRPAPITKLSYNPNTRMYEGEYVLPDNAQYGQYAVEVTAVFGGQKLREYSYFSVSSTEDYFALEQKAKQFALEKNYGPCAENYIKAAKLLSSDPRRLSVDVEKAGVCISLGKLSSAYYLRIGDVVAAAGYALVDNSPSMQATSAVLGGGVPKKVEPSEGVGSQGNVQVKLGVEPVQTQISSSPGVLRFESYEGYYLYGVAAQYYELGGDYATARSLLEKAAKGIERKIANQPYQCGVFTASQQTAVSSNVQQESVVSQSNAQPESLPANVKPTPSPAQGRPMPPVCAQNNALDYMVLAKYHSLLGNAKKSSEYYGKAADLLSAGSFGDEHLSLLLSANLYAKAGNTESAKKLYLLAGDELSGKYSSGSEQIIFAFLAGDAYEKGGDLVKAKLEYQKATSFELPQSYSAADIYFARASAARAYERLGDKEAGKRLYTDALSLLNAKAGTEAYYFAAGLSGYLGDYVTAKTLCQQTFEQSFSEESDLGKFTFMNAYCHSVLGDSVRAKKGCDLNAITPQGDQVMLEYLMAPLPPPVSYCAQSASEAIPIKSCGNGVVDAGETSQNCCVDTGCAFGDVCSKAISKCVKPVKEISQETILDVLLKLEDARIKLDVLEGKALGISKYYDGKEQAKSAAWAKAAKVFGDAKLKIDGIKNDLKANKDKMDEAALEGMRGKLDGVRSSLKEAVDAILEAV